MSKESELKQNILKYSLLTGLTIVGSFVLNNIWHKINKTDAINNTQPNTAEIFPKEGVLVGLNTHLSFEEPLNPEITYLGPQRFEEAIAFVTENGLNALRFNIQAHEIMPMDENGSLNVNQAHLDELASLTETAHQEGINLQLVLTPPVVDKSIYDKTAEEYFRAVVNSTKGNIHSYQIFNEADAHNYFDYSLSPAVDDNYLRELSAQVSILSGIIREKDPNAKVSVNVSYWAGYGGESYEEFQNRMKVFLPSLVKYVDIIGLDYYPDLNPDAIENTTNVVEWLQEEFGVQVDIVEIGLSTAPGEFTQVEQAQSIIDTLEEAQTVCASVILYEYRDQEDPEVQNQHEQYFGVGDNPNLTDITTTMRELQSICERTP